MTNSNLKKDISWRFGADSGIWRASGLLVGEKNFEILKKLSSPSCRYKREGVFKINKSLETQ
jgi:hypothetical protein